MEEVARRGRGRVIPHRRGGVYIYVPKDVAEDSSFTLKRGDVSIGIGDGRLIIEPEVEAVTSDAREENYEIYKQIREEFLAKYRGRYAVIATGRVLSIADSPDEAVRTAEEKASNTRHRILWKIGEDEVESRRRLGGTWLRRRK